MKGPIVASGTFSVSLTALQSTAHPSNNCRWVISAPAAGRCVSPLELAPRRTPSEKNLEDKCPPSLHPTIPCTGGKTWPSLYSIDSRHCTNYNCSYPPFVAARQKQRSSEDWRWRRSLKFCKEAESLESGIINTSAESLNGCELKT